MSVNRSLWFSTRSDINRPIQLKKKAGSLKFQILEEDELFYLSSENKGADQLCRYCTADLRLLFSHRKNLVFLLWVNKLITITTVTL